MQLAVFAGYVAGYLRARHRVQPGGFMAMPAVQSRPQLVRELCVSRACAVVVGTIIGSGIFLVPAEMMQAVGSAKLVYLRMVGGLLFVFRSTDLRRTGQPCRRSEFRRSVALAPAKRLLILRNDFARCCQRQHRRGDRSGLQGDQELGQSHGLGTPNGTALVDWLMKNP